MTITNKKIFITGGAGFIGSRLAGDLCEHNEIILYDNLTRNSLQYTNLDTHKNVRLIEGDILDKDFLTEAMQGSEIVIHAAAIAGIDSVIKSPVKTMEVNMIGTANLLDAAYINQVSDRVIDISTSEVFGQMAFKASESDQTIAGSAGEARWAYAVSKLAGEHLAKAYYKQYRLPVVTVRPFNIYGPGQTGEGALQIFIRRALANQPLYIDGDGSQIRAWCYIDDMIGALLKCIEVPKAIGESFNIGNARAVLTIYSLASTIIRVLNSNSAIIFNPPLSVDIQLRVPNTTKAKSLLDFEAQTELEQGILQTAEWYLQHAHLKMPARSYGSATI